VNGDSSLPLEDFIQAITSQLDRTQATMALKAKAGMPLTFAVRDLRLDLRAHVDMQGGAVTIRPAAPGDVDASRLHLELTTITKPMIEENTRDLSADAETPSIREVLGDDLSDEEERRLEWAGIQTVAQYRQLQRSGGTRIVEKLAPRPVDKLRAALEMASRPRLDAVTPIRSRAPWEPVGEGQPGDGHGIPQLRLRGANLRGSTGRPIVRIAGEPVSIVDATDDSVVVQPTALPFGALAEVETAEGTAQLTVDPDGPPTTDVNGAPR
jgi:hypothetical protein